MRRLHAVGPDTAGKAIASVVRHAHGLGDSIERDRTDHRAENFLLGYAHRVSNIRKNRRGYEIAPVVSLAG